MKSKAPKEARVVPGEMTKGSEEAKKKLEAAYRARAAHGMLKSASWKAALKSNPDAVDPCPGDSIDGQEADS